MINCQMIAAIRSPRRSSVANAGGRPFCQELGMGWVHISHWNDPNVPYFDLSYMYPAHTQLLAKWSSPSIGDQRATGCRIHLNQFYNLNGITLIISFRYSVQAWKNFTKNVFLLIHFPSHLIWSVCHRLPRINRGRVWVLLRASMAGLNQESTHKGKQADLGPG